MKFNTFFYCQIPRSWVQISVAKMSYLFNNTLKFSQEIKPLVGKTLMYILAVIISFWKTYFYINITTERYNKNELKCDRKNVILIDIIPTQPNNMKNLLQ